MIIFEILEHIAADIGNANRIYFEDLFAEKGVEVLFGARVTRIDDDVIEYVQKGWTRKLLGVDTIILAAGARANDTLWKIAGE